MQVNYLSYKALTNEHRPWRPEQAFCPSLFSFLVQKIFYFINIVGGTHGTAHRGQRTAL